MTQQRLVCKKGLKALRIPYSSAHIARLESKGLFPKRYAAGRELQRKFPESGSREESTAFLHAGSGSSISSSIRKLIVALMLIVLSIAAAGFIAGIFFPGNPTDPIGVKGAALLLALFAAIGGGFWYAVVSVARWVFRPPDLERVSLRSRPSGGRIGSELTPEFDLE